MPLDESILCIPTAHFHELGHFLGFRALDSDALAQLLDPAQLTFQPRRLAEHDPSYKQLIPYIILSFGDRLFHYRRGSSGNEKRLESLRSIGIGGHISEADAKGGDDPYRTGMIRELTEEVEIADGWHDEFLGLINDDRTPVGSVHLGLVHRITLSEPTVMPLEDALADSGFASIDELSRERSQFETWSQFALEELHRR